MMGNINKQKIIVTNIIQDEKTNIFSISSKLNGFEERKYIFKIQKDNIKSEINFIYFLDKPIILKDKVTVKALKGSTQSKVILNMKVYFFSDSNIKLLPELEIEESDVDIDHHVSMGGFSEQEVFYLKSKGISKESAVSSLIKSLIK